MQLVADCCSFLQLVAACFSLLQHVAVSRVLQRVAVWCSVLLRNAWSFAWSLTLSFYYIDKYFMYISYLHTFQNPKPEARNPKPEALNHESPLYLYMQCTLQHTNASSVSSISIHYIHRSRINILQHPKHKTRNLIIPNPTTLHFKPTPGNTK